MTIFSDSSGTGNLFFADGTTGDEAYRGFLRYTHSSDSMEFYTAGANLQMLIDSSGTVLVGTTSDTGTSAGHVLFGVGAAYHVRDGGFTNLFKRLNSDGEILRFSKDTTQVGSIGTANGDLFIGTTNNSDESYLRFAFGGVGIVPATSAGLANDNALDLGASGARFKDLYLAGTATVASLVETSTRKLKENIETLEDQSSVVDSLQPVSYTWKETEKEDFGLVAEDVADIAPHLVERDNEGNPTGIKYSKLSVLLLDVVQRQSTLIEDLNERITKLENERGN